MSRVDWAAIEAELKDVALDALKGLADGAKQDLQAYGAEIAKDLAYAIKEGRGDLRGELLQQARLLAEIHRVRLVKEAYQVLDRVVDVAVRVGRAAVAAAL